MLLLSFNFVNCYCINMEFIEVIRLAEQLNESIKADPRYQTLLALERDMDSNDEVAALADAMRQSAIDWESIPEGGLRRDEAQKRLHQAKLALDCHPLVRRYYEAYGAVRVLYDTIQKEIFTPFNLHVCGGER